MEKIEPNQPPTTNHQPPTNYTHTQMMNYFRSLFSRQLPTTSSTLSAQEKRRLDEERRMQAIMNALNDFMNKIKDEEEDEELPIALPIAIACASR